MAQSHSGIQGNTCSDYLAKTAFTSLGGLEVPLPRSKTSTNPLFAAASCFPAARTDRRVRTTRAEHTADNSASPDDTGSFPTAPAPRQPPSATAAPTPPSGPPPRRGS